MIEFHYEIDFKLSNEGLYRAWLKNVVSSEDAEIAQLDFVFCADDYLLEKNIQFLKHDTYTDIITFDYSEGKRIGGDVFISIDRLKENTDKYKVTFEEELLRVMAHGVLHLLGYSDKNDADTSLMRTKENEMIRLFHVEQ